MKPKQQKPEALDFVKKVIVIFAIIFSVMALLIALSPRYVDNYIQDVENWCCKNTNATFSPTGENCTEIVGQFNPQYCDRNR